MIRTYHERPFTAAFRRGVIVLDDELNPVGLVYDTPKGIISEHILPAGSRMRHDRTPTGAHEAYNNALANRKERKQ